MRFRVLKIVNVSLGGALCTDQWEPPQAQKSALRENDETEYFGTTRRYCDGNRVSLKTLAPPLHRFITVTITSAILQEGSLLQNTFPIICPCNGQHTSLLPPSVIFPQPCGTFHSDRDDHDEAQTPQLQGSADCPFMSSAILILLLL